MFIADILLNVFVLFASSIVSYFIFLQMYNRWECWDLEKWSESLNQYLSKIDKSYIYVNADSYKRNAYIGYLVNNEVKDLNRRNSIIRKRYVAGKKIIKFFKVSPYIFLALLLLSAIGVLLLLISNTLRDTLVECAALFLRTTTLYAVIFGTISGLQWILYNNLNKIKSVELSDAMELSNLENLVATCFVAKSLEFRPIYSYLLYNTKSFMTIYESNQKLDYKLFKNAKLYLFVSIKKREFNSSFYNYVFSNFLHVVKSLEIILVDRPYIENLKVDFSGKELDRKIDNLYSKVRADKLLNIEKTMNGISTNLKDKVIVSNWESLDKFIDIQIQNEIISALNGEGIFYNDVIAEIANVLKCEKAIASKYIGFFVEELPILLSIYYGNNKCFDCYPDENSYLIWRLEKGKYKNELPYITNLALNNPLCYFKIISK